MQYIDYVLYGLLALTVSLSLFSAHRIHLQFNESSSKKLTETDIEALLDKTEGYLLPLSLIATNAVYVGLGATVLHIVDALQKIGAAQADISIVAGPIGVALYATLWGLCSAVLAHVSYTVLARSIQKRGNELVRKLKAG